jgi:hypothetical protein
MSIFIRLSLVLVIFSSLFNFGCSSAGSSVNIQKPGLEINNVITAVGSAYTDTNNNNHDIQRFSYTISLTNNDMDTVLIKEIALELPKEFEETLITKKLNVTVNKDLLPKSSIEINGSMDFRAIGLSKEDIIKLDPRIVTVKVINERTISLQK